MYAKNSAKSPARKMADGGSVGLFERLKAGNIDDPKSEAFRRWGAGSKSVDSATSPAPTPPSPSPADTASMSPPSSASISDDSDYGNEHRRGSAGPSETVKPPKPKPRKMAPTKPAPKPTSAAAPADSRPRGQGDGSVATTPAPADSRPRGQDAGPKTAFVPGPSLAGRTVDAIKDIFAGGPVTKARNYVNGGLIGNPTANQSVKKEALTNPSFKQNALGGGRASYGKK